MPGAELDEAVDAQGEAAVAVLRALGLPAIVVAVQGGGGSTLGGPGAPAGMKERSAAKKRAEKAVSAQVGGRGTQSLLAPAGEDAVPEWNTSNWLIAACSGEDAVPGCNLLFLPAEEYPANSDRLCATFWPPGPLPRFPGSTP